MLTDKTTRSLRLGLLILLSTIATALWAESTKDSQKLRNTVVASIKPLQLIVKEIAGPHLLVEVLLPANASPHFYHLRPSDLKKLTEADLLFWVGADMETFLPKVINSFSLKNMTLAEPDAHKEQQKNGHHSSHDNTHYGHDHDDNPHVWIDPAFVAERSDDILATLVNLYPHLEQTFTNNHQAFKNRLEKLIEDYQARFSSIKKRDIYSEHDAFSPLSQHFDLDVKNFISQTPEKKPGAAHLSALSHAIDASEKICFLTESNALSRYLQVIRGSADVKETSIDILATNINTTKSVYTTYIAQLLEQIYHCVTID